jgi:AsmA protein
MNEAGALIKFGQGLRQPAAVDTMIARRTSLALSTGLLLAAGAALAIPWRLYNEALQDHLAKQVRATTGLETELQFAPKLSLLPRPGIRLRGLVLHDLNNSLRIEAPTATSYIRLLSLFTGRLELSSLVLSRPTLMIDVDRARLPQTSALALAAAATRDSAAAAQADAARLGTLRIESGLVCMRSAGLDTLIDDVQAILTWPTIGAPIALVGHANWRSMSGELSVRIDTPNALLRGDESAVSVQFTSNPGKLSFDGSIVFGNHPQVSGRLIAAVSSLDTLMTVFNAEMPLSEAVRSLALSGDIRASTRDLSLTSANLTTDGNAFEGSLALSRSAGRLRLSGTLATDMLTLDPVFAGLRSAVGVDAGAIEEATSPMTQRLAGDLSHGDIDLRVSAANVQLRQVKFSDAALSLLSTDGSLELSLAEARGYHGMVKAKALIGTGQNGLDVRTSASFTDGDIGALLTDAVGMNRLTGSGSLAFTMETNGSSFSQLQENLDGHGQIGFGPGEVSGIDVEQALRRAERKTPVRLPEFENWSGRTAFDHARANFVVSKGLLSIDDGEIAGPGVVMTLTGAVSTIDGSGKLQAIAAQVGESTDATRLSLEITGPWRHPSIRSNVDKGDSQAHPISKIDE